MTKPQALFNDSAEVISVICHFTDATCLPKGLQERLRKFSHTPPKHTHTGISIIRSLHALCRRESGRVSCLPVYKLSHSEATTTRKVCYLLDGWQWPWRRRRRRLAERKNERHTPKASEWEMWRGEMGHKIRTYRTGQRNSGPSSPVENEMGKWGWGK